MTNVAMSATLTSTPIIHISSGVGSPISTPSTPTTPLATGVHQRLLLKQTAIDTWSLKGEPYKRFDRL